MKKTERAPGVAAESELKSHVRHAGAYPATRNERTGADGLAGTMKTQTRNTFPKTRNLGCNFRFVVIEFHARHLFFNCGCRPKTQFSSLDILAAHR